MGEDREKAAGEAEMREERDDVEAHKRHFEAEDKVAAKDAAATEEGPDVEAHKKHPKVSPT